MVSLRPRGRPQPAFTEPPANPPSGGPIETPPAARTRTRQRSLEIEPEAPPAAGHNGQGTPTPEILTLVEQTFLANRDKNRASVRETQSRKKLLVQLKDAGIDQKFTHTFNVDNAPTTVEIEIATPEIGTIDIQKLKAKVSEEVFLKIVSATVAAVTKHAGTNLMQECLTTKPGTENVSVSVPK